MQRTLQVIAFALLCVGVFTTVTPSNFVKAPAAVTVDGPFLTNPSVLTTGLGGVDLVATTANSTDPKNITLTAFLKKIDTKGLTAEATTRNVSFTEQDSGTLFAGGYMIDVTTGVYNGSTIPQVIVSQKSFTGGAAIPMFALTSNTDATFTFTTPSYVSMAFGKTIAVIYNTPTGYNLTSFKVGGSAAGAPHVITAVKSQGVAGVWGEALKATQVYITWTDISTATTPVYKSATFDIGSGIVGTPASPTKMITGMVCRAYTTDKKYYGDYCSVAGTANGTAVTSYYIRTNGTDLYWFANTTTGEEIHNVVAYGQYVALFFKSKATDNTETRSTEILNLDTLTAFRAKTAYLTISADDKGATTLTEARLDQGGYYMLFMDSAVNETSKATTYSYKVGLLLSGSTLSTVFGALLALIAGLFLF